MDLLKRLSLEYNRIYDVLIGVADKANKNYLCKLEQGIENKDIDVIKYTLGKLYIWLKNNLNECCNITIFDDPNEYIECLDIIRNFHDGLMNYKIPVTMQPKNISQSKEIPYIFLSHKSDEKKYGDALRNFITGLGVKNDQLIYTSHPLHKIPLDKNIYEFLREHISKNVFVIILWSDKYLESPACLNEMGAAWVAQSDYTNIYVPTFSFGNPKYHECAVDTRKMGAVLNGDEHCKTSMIELKNKIQTLFKLENDEKQSNYLLDQFMKEITEDSQNGQT